MYFLLDVENVSDSAEEWLSHWAFDWGAQGVSEVLSYHQEEGEEAVETVPRPSRTTCTSIFNNVRIPRFFRS